jgi:hypothetical protein
VTSADAVEFLWQATKPFVLIQEIELAVRHLMQSACTGEDLADRIRAIPLPNRNPVPTTLVELSLGEMINVLTHGPNFGEYFRRTFGQSRELVLSYLQGVPKIRNQVFHFRDDASVEQLEALLNARDWLLRKIRTLGQAR